MIWFNLEGHLEFVPSAPPAAEELSAMFVKGRKWTRVKDKASFKVRDELRFEIPDV